MRLASILLALSVCPLALGAVACGGDNVAVGDYQAFRIASTEAKVSGDCFVDDPTSEHTSNFRSGGTVLIYNAPEADEDEYYLDSGGTVFPGEKADDGSYEFQGQETDVELGGDTIIDSDHDGIEDFDDPLVDSDGDGLDDQSQIEDPSVDVDMDGLDDRLGDEVDQNNDGIDDRQVFVPNDTKITQKNTYTVEILPEGGKVTGTITVQTEVSCSGSQCGNFQTEKCKSTTEFVGVEVDPESVAIPVGNDSN